MRRLYRSVEQFLDAGFRVFPIKMISKGWGEHWQSKLDLKLFFECDSKKEILEEFFRYKPRNGAIVCGRPSGVVVLDADSEEQQSWIEKNLSPTPLRVCTARGLHYYYRYPIASSSSDTRSYHDIYSDNYVASYDNAVRMEVRGDCGFVLMPGSKHPEGTDYRIVGTNAVPDIDSLPIFQCEWMRLCHEPTRVERAVASEYRSDLYRLMLNLYRADISEDMRPYQQFEMVWHVRKWFDLPDASCCRIIQYWGRHLAGRKDDSGELSRSGNSGDASPRL